MPYRNILCPIDFSDASYEALATAGGLAGRFSASLAVVHVVFRIAALYGMEGLSPECDVISYEKALGASVRDMLEKETPKRMPAGISPRLLIKYGDPARQIVATAEEEGADLIVIATHGMSGWRHYVFGSVAQKVIRHTDRHVLLVHSNPDDGQETDTIPVKDNVKEIVPEKNGPCIQPA